MMSINGVDYPSGPLTAPSGAACVGGFQVVILNASTFSSLPPAFNVPVNQTFGTNCGDADTDVAQINRLASTLAVAINSQAAAGSGAPRVGRSCSCRASATRSCRPGSRPSRSRRPG